MPLQAGINDFTWQGDDATSPSDYGVAENWDLGVVPVFERSIFSDTASTFTVDLNGDRSIQDLEFRGATGYTINGLGDTLNISALNVDASGATHTINSNVEIGTDTWAFGAGSTLVVNGPVSEIVAGRMLTKTGPGTLVFNDAGAYTGGTVVDGGTLLANNTTGSATGTGTVVLSNGGALGGAGSVAGTVDAIGGAVVPGAPGAPIGVLTVGGVNLFGGGSSSLDIEVAGAGGVPGTDYDQLVVNNTASLLGGELNLTYTGGFTPTHQQTITVIDAAALNGAFSQQRIISPAGGAWIPTHNTVAGDVSLTFASDFDWLPATGDYFTAGNWDVNLTPDAMANVFVRNGGVASATSGGPALVRELTVGGVVGGGDGALTFDGVDLSVAQDLNIAGSDNEQTVGDQTVVASVAIENTALLDVSTVSSVFDTHVATLRAGEGQTVSATGSLAVDNVTTVNLGQDLEAGEIRPGDPVVINGDRSYGTASITTDADVSVNNAQNVTITEDIELSNIASAGASASALLDASADLRVTDVAGTLAVGEDFEVSEFSDAFGGSFAGTASTRATATLSDIGSVTVAEDFEIGRAGVASSDFGSITFTGSVSSNGAASITNVATLTVAEDIDVGLAFVRTDSAGAFTGTVDVAGSLTLEGVAATVTDTGGRTRVGGLVDEGNAPITAADVDVAGTLTMTASSLTTPTLEVGTKTNPGTVANVSGVVEMNPSYITTDDLILGEDGDLILHLEGLDRVTLSTVGDAGTYSAIDAVDGLLGGEIVADFDFVPTPGTHVFDLIVTGSLTALDDATMLAGDFQVVGLFPGFTVDFFGIVEDGTDIVRLQISGAAIPEPASAALLSLGGFVLVGRRRSPKMDSTPRPSATGTLS